MNKSIIDMTREEFIKFVNKITKHYYYRTNKKTRRYMPFTLVLPEGDVDEKITKALKENPECEVHFHRNKKGSLS